MPHFTALGGICVCVCVSTHVCAHACVYAGDGESEVSNLSLKYLRRFIVQAEDMHLPSKCFLGWRRLHADSRCAEDLR